MHARAPLMSLATTCDLGKGKFSVLIWQLMSFPPPTDGPWHSTGTAAGCHSNREKVVGVGMGGGLVKEEFRVFLYASVCLCANICKLSASLLYFLSVLLCAPL